MFCHRPPFLLLMIFPLSCLRQLRRDNISTQRRKKRINNSTFAPEARHTSLHLYIPAPYTLPPLTCLRLSTGGLVLFHTKTMQMLHNTNNGTHDCISLIFQWLILENIHVEDRSTGWGRNLTNANSPCSNSTGESVGEPTLLYAGPIKSSSATSTLGSTCLSVNAARIATCWIMIVGQSEGSTNMLCGSLDVEQSLPQPSPGQCSISVMITIPLWYAALVDQLITPSVRFIGFNHINILQHAHRDRGMTNWLA